MSRVDVVTLVRSEAEKQLRQFGVGDTVVEIEGLACAETLHAVVAKSNPNGQAYLDLLNRGLATLMLSGQWFEVVAFHQSLQLSRAQ